MTWLWPHRFAIAGFFLLFAIPCFLFVKERGNPNPRTVLSLAMVRESTAETIRTLRSGRDYPGLVRFLVGRVFYTELVRGQLRMYDPVSQAVTTVLTLPVPRSPEVCQSSTISAAKARIAKR